MPLSEQRPFFFLEKAKIPAEGCCHRSKTPQELQDFHTEFRTFALFPAFTQNMKSYREHWAGAKSQIFLLEKCIN